MLKEGNMPDRWDACTQQKCGLCARHLDAGQRLEGAFEVHRRYGSRVQDVRVAEAVGLVEEQQDDHLVRAHVELVPLLPKGRPHVCTADAAQQLLGAHHAVSIARAPQQP